MNYWRVATASPSLKVGDVAYNKEQIVAMAGEAAERKVRIMAFPSLRQRAARSFASSFCWNRRLDAVKVNCSAGAREGSLGWIPPAVICTVQKGSGLKAAI